MIHQLNIYGKDKVEIAIERLQTMMPEDGYYLAFSGGKDSCVIKALADMAGVKYDAHYNNTGIDPPEVLYFMKEHHPDVQWETPRDKDGKRVTMWNLIERKIMPPTRIVRYCCSWLKEGGGEGRFVITGVRWAESAKRKNTRHLAEMKKKNVGQHFYTDNLEDAPMFKFCPAKSNRVLNPIIDWTDEDVWEFIREYKIPYCCLYDQGVKRVGCIGCPMGGGKQQKLEFERYPRYRNLYIKAFERMLKVNEERGLQYKYDWRNAEDVMTWWTDGWKESDRENQRGIESLYSEEDLQDL